MACGSEETWDHLGLRASGSHDVIFEDVAVPADHAVDLRPPEGWRKPDLQAAGLEHGDALRPL